MSVYNKQSKASTQPRLGVVFPLGAEYMHSGHCEMLWIKVFYNKYKLNTEVTPTTDTLGRLATMENVSTEYHQYRQRQ